MAHRPLWVILCCLLEKGRKEIEEIVGDEREGLGKILTLLGFNDMSTLVGQSVSSARERKKRDRRDSRGDVREGQGRKENECQ